MDVIVSNYRVLCVVFQQENDIISEWLIKEHPDVGVVLTGGVGFSVRGHPIWAWSGSENIMLYHKFWPGRNKQQQIAELKS